MTALRATAIEELCHTLGLRTPIGVGAADQSVRSGRANTPEPTAADVAHFTDEQLVALGVLAAPEAIAVVTVSPRLQRFARALPVVHVIAIRGPWLAEHVIEGDAHHLHATDADHAAAVLLDRCGLARTGDAADAGVRRDAVDVTFHGYRRMTELARVGDTRRAQSALVADGASPAAAAALVGSVAVGQVEVAGLGSDGRRFIGCDLALAGDGRTGRWSVPSTQHVDAVPHHAFRHPSMGALAAFGGVAGNIRVLVEPTTAAEIRGELRLIFGDA